MRTQASVRYFAVRWPHYTTNIKYVYVTYNQSSQKLALNVSLILANTNNNKKAQLSAIADKHARHESMPKIAPIRRANAYNVVADNSFRLAVVAPEIWEIPRNSLKIHKLIEFKVIQGHRSWCQWKAHVTSH